MLLRSGDFLVLNGERESKGSRDGQQYLRSWASNHNNSLGISGLQLVNELTSVPACVFLVFSLVFLIAGFFRSSFFVPLSATKTAWK
jgi:hypothetical protein